MRKLSISDKLILASLLLSIITIVIVASYSFYNAREAILERTFNQLTSVRTVKKSLLENYFHNRTREVELVGLSSDIKSLSMQINEVEGSGIYKYSNSLLGSVNHQFIESISGKYFSSIAIVGNNKVVYQLMDTPMSQLELHKDYNELWKGVESNTNPLIVDLTVPDSLSLPIIVISSKILDSLNNTVGIIVFELSHNLLDSIMLEVDPSKGLGVSGESYLVGDDLLMRSSSRFQQNSILSTIVETEAVKNAFAGESGTMVLDDYRGVSVLSSYGKIDIPNLNWVILAEMDFNEATKQIYQIRNEIVFISIFIFFLVLLVVFILSRRITFPLQRLNHAASELGKGNFDVEIVHHLNDEIGDLTDTFNNMVNKLKVQSQELESERVKSLTSLIDGQESERQRLSRELHDSLGQLLIALKLKYESCLIKSQSGNLESNSFTDLGSLFDKTIDETRRISNNLMPAALSEFGLTSALRNICNDVSENSEIEVLFATEGDTSGLSTKQKTYIFRIGQESLTNILKHSNAKNASILLISSDKEIELLISDDGHGFDVDKVNLKRSNGLVNIKDRVSLLKGTFAIESNNTNGTKLTITIPR